MRSASGSCATLLAPLRVSARAVPPFQRLSQPAESAYLLERPALRNRLQHPIRQPAHVLPAPPAGRKRLERGHVAPPSFLVEVDRLAAAAQQLALAQVVGTQSMVRPGRHQ